MAHDTPERKPDDSNAGQKNDVTTSDVARDNGVLDSVALPGGKTVLVVDDVSVMRLRMRPQIEEAGYRVLEAEDGERALEIIRSDSGVSLVITDVNMPVMDGLEFIRKLRGELNLTRLPVILCTARGEISVVRKAKLLGIQGFLVKPVTKTTLLAAIKREIG